MILNPGLLAVLTVSVLKGISLLVSYINNNAFPQPLSKEEEDMYLARMKNGDEDARHILIEHNLRLVAHVIKKFESTGEDLSDLISIGTIGLIKAINTFDKDKGTKLATYAARCIENEILMHLRSKKKTKGEVSMYDPIGVDKEGNEINLMDILGSEEDVADKVENRQELNRLMKKLKRLNKREKSVIEMRFGLINGLKKTQKEIAKKMGISRSYVSRIEKKAVQKIIKEMENEEKNKNKND